jgi:hypothetical protein
LRKIWSMITEILNQFEVIFHLMLSSFREFLILVWSPKPKFKIWGISKEWLLWYSSFIILRLSYIGGCLHFKNLQFWFGPLSLSFKSEEDPMSGCWDRTLTNWWGGKSNFKLLRRDGWVGEWVGGRVGRWLTIQILIPLCGPFLQDETCQIFSQAEISR